MSEHLKFLKIYEFNRREKKRIRNLKVALSASLELNGSVGKSVLSFKTFKMIKFRLCTLCDCCCPLICPVLARRRKHFLRNKIYFEAADLDRCDRDLSCDYKKVQFEYSMIPIDRKLAIFFLSLSF